MKLTDILEAFVLGAGMSKEARARDTEESDYEYIAQRQAKQERLKHVFKPGDKVWHKSRQEVGIFKMLDDRNTPTNDNAWVEFPDSHEEVMVTRNRLEPAGNRKTLHHR